MTSALKGAIWAGFHGVLLTWNLLETCLNLLETCLNAWSVMLEPTLLISNVTKDRNDLQDTNKKLDIQIKEKDKFQEDLTREVTGLQLKLSEVTKERSYLQETVHKLNEELRVQENKFSQMKALLISIVDNFFTVYFSY